MTNAATVVSAQPKLARTKAERWGARWNVACPILVVLGFFLLNNYHNQRVAAVQEAADVAAAQAKLDVAAAREDGKRLGRHEAIGQAKTLLQEERYVFHGVHLIRGKTFALLTDPEGGEPQLYRLDLRQFPKGFPGEGGILRPVAVDGYFEPFGGAPKPVVRRARRAVRTKPANPRTFSSASLPQDWPQRLPALPPVMPR